MSLAQDRRSVRRSRFAAVLLSSCFAAAAVGCSSADDVRIAAPEEATGVVDEAIVDVVQTEVERQSIGNCWLYAEASWAESMHRTATGEEFDISQSYWTYWHWYGQITGRDGWLSGDALQTGGGFRVANGIIRRYGLVAEPAFVPEDAAVGVEMSQRQARALSVINDELQPGGRLATTTDRRNGTLVRTVLNEAWLLAPTVVAYLDTAFGADGLRTIDRGAATASGTPVVLPTDFAAAYTMTPGGAVQTKTLATAMRDWIETGYPSSASARRTMQQRIQRALHDDQPGIVSWFVDFNAMESRVGLPLSGSFALPTLTAAGAPGRQGGHMVVLEDYEAVVSPTETLKAGVTLDKTVPADQAKLEAALATTTKLSFLRIKNSWGKSRRDRGFSPGFPGYHDLYLDYLEARVTRCTETENAVPLAERGCTSTTTPFQSVILPRAYFTTPR